MNHQERDSLKTWDDLEFFHVGLWRHLVRWDYNRAAVGLLQDLFKELHDRRNGPEEHVMRDGRTMREHLVELSRRRLKEMLGIFDEGELDKLEELYAAYRYAEQDYEREAFLQHEFLQKAVALVLEHANRVREEQGAQKEDD
jgi:hypothetical protein